MKQREDLRDFINKNDQPNVVIDSKKLQFFINKNPSGATLFMDAEDPSIKGKLVSFDGIYFKNTTLEVKNSSSSEGSIDFVLEDCCFQGECLIDGTNTLTMKNPNLPLFLSDKEVSLDLYGENIILTDCSLDALMGTVQLVGETVTLNNIKETNSSLALTVYAKEIASIKDCELSQSTPWNIADTGSLIIQNCHGLNEEDKFSLKVGLAHQITATKTDHSHFVLGRLLGGESLSIVDSHDLILESEVADGGIDIALKNSSFELRHVEWIDTLSLTDSFLFLTGLSTYMKQLSMEQSQVSSGHSLLIGKLLQLSNSSLVSSYVELGNIVISDGQLTDVTVARIRLLQSLVECQRASNRAIEKRLIPWFQQELSGLYQQLDQDTADLAGQKKIAQLLPKRK